MDKTLKNYWEKNAVAYGNCPVNKVNVIFETPNIKTGLWNA